MSLEHTHRQGTRQNQNLGPHALYVTHYGLFICMWPHDLTYVATTAVSALAFYLSYRSVCVTIYIFEVFVSITYCSCSSLINICNPQSKVMSGVNTNWKIKNWSSKHVIYVVYCTVIMHISCNYIECLYSLHHWRHCCNSFLLAMDHPCMGVYLHCGRV